MTGPVLLEADGIHAGYGDFLVLEGASITVEEGSVVCLIGPNGAGKSTLFKTIYGLVEPRSGTVRHRGESVVGLDQRELLDRGIAYVLQRNSVFPEMTVRENLEMGAFAAPDGYDVEARIAEMCELFPVIDERIEQRAGAMSGGQQQMVELARGLMLEPDLLLLDEPTAGLAPKIVDDVFEKVGEINDRGVAVLMIEQNVRTGVRYADHVYLLENGRTVLDGPADGFLERPEIREVYLKGGRGDRDRGETDADAEARR
jgi:ABC-type branched-subunit amino acid transport system ATPase component